ncbi:regulatory protein, ArsR [Methanoregula boonei 6A8]|jgi:predicted transcriptional regulator|uniref:Regulatory protein, ArsR n=1 Tax=Methanoregula boonei (strain DSM 21154 / JCM 14090 / 6A8) TaxID=456442 RepID=A7I7J6_METB6|nr:winged helix-turn-helix transcriptional regulator [Methanoregula boonei]ABS55707.1 regulatory protein, ArsR [Methanoregula boonei 6A8]
MKNATKVLLFFLLFSFIIAVASGGYTVTPYVTPYSLSTGPYDASGADAHVSFFQLPLWIQISCITGAVLAFLALFKCIPLVLGRVEELLDNKNRRAILDYVGSHPGCTITDISQNTGLNRGTVKYHLFLLLREQKIVRKNDGNKMYHFKNGGASPERKQEYGYIRNPRKREILMAILNEPGISNATLAERLHLDKSSVHRHLHQFLEEKMIESHWDGKNVGYTVTPEVAKMLAEFSE